jgi:uncharacterized protein
MSRVKASFRPGALVALVLFLLSAVLAFSAPFETEPLTIRTQAGASHKIVVELAITSDQRALGLMNRKEMAADHGMLFDFGMTRRVAMWMKNTYLPLDMLFIRKDGTIAHIAADTVPQSEAIIDSREEVHFVLELNAGTSKRLGITPGDRVESTTIGGAEPKP